MRLHQRIMSEEHYMWRARSSESEACIDGYISLFFLLLLPEQQSAQKRQNRDTINLISRSTPQTQNGRNHHGFELSERTAPLYWIDRIALRYEQNVEE